MITTVQTSETIGLCTNEIQSVSNKISEDTEDNEQTTKNSNTFQSVTCVIFIAALMLIIVFVSLQIIPLLRKGPGDTYLEKIKTTELWEVVIGNESLTAQEIVAQIFIIPTKLPSNQSLILMHELNIELKGFNKSDLNHSDYYNTNNFSIIPDTIIELNENYTINKILTNRNESRNVVLYAFSYFYENCFDKCDEQCGISVDFEYSMRCGHEVVSNENIAMKINKVEDLAEDSVSIDVSHNLMHRILSKYYEYDDTDSHFSSYFDHDVYDEQDWHQFSWSIDDDHKPFETTTSTDSSNDTKQKEDVDRRNLQSGFNFMDYLPENFEDDVLNCISSFLNDTLWVEACGFLLDGCDYYTSTVASGSFSKWWAGKYSYGVEEFCIKIKALPYISSHIMKEKNSNKGSMELNVGMKQYDWNTAAVQASFHAYVSQKLCIGFIFFEWCYRNVEDTVDVTFEINPVFTLDLYYGISMDTNRSNATDNSLEVIVEVGLDNVITELLNCNFDYDHNDDRSLADYFSYLIPFVNMLPITFDNAIDFLVELIDDNICRLAAKYSQEYISEQLDKLLNNKREYLTWINVDDSDIMIQGGLIYLYHNVWRIAGYDYSANFEISDVCTEILMQ